MGPPQRIRYNAKARQSSAGGPARKKRKLDDLDESNAEIILPQEAKEEKARRDALIKEMRSNINGQISSKKKKRMEKYIDKKLGQEERQHLFYKLADTQATTNPLNLQSSSKLGTGKVETHKQGLEKEEHLEVKRLVRKGSKRGRQFGPISDDSDGTEGFSEPEVGPSDTVNQLIGQPKSPTPVPAPAVPQMHTVGSALARDDSGNAIAPRVVKKKKKVKEKNGASRNNTKSPIPCKGTTSQSLTPRIRPWMTISSQNPTLLKLTEMMLTMATQKIVRVVIKSL